MNSKVVGGATLRSANHLRKKYNTVLPDSQPPTVAFIVLDGCVAQRLKKMRVVPQFSPRWWGKELRIDVTSQLWKPSEAGTRNEGFFIRS